MRNWGLFLLPLLTIFTQTSKSQQDFYCNEPVDIALLLDSSANFGAVNFAELKAFAKDFLSYFELKGKGLTPHIGVIPYGDKVMGNKVINFRFSTSQRRLSSRMDRLSYDGGAESRLDLALEYARVSLFKHNKGSRPWVPRVVLAITGTVKSWNERLREAIKRQALAMRAQGFQLLVASIGQINKPDEAALESMVGSKDNLYLLRYPYGLRQVAKEMMQEVCPKPSTFACPGKVDIAFIVDSSGSISRPDYKKMKYFIYSIAKALNVSETGAHAGVVIYSSRSELAIKFSDTTNIASFQKAVYNLEHMKALTRIDLGLIKAHSQLFTQVYGGARPNVKKIAFILTDGKQSTINGVKESVREAAKPLIESGIKTFAIGIGPAVDRNELRAMVESDGDVTTATNFDELLKRIENITRLPCQEIGPGVCQGDVDLAFILDSSGSIEKENFRGARNFIGNLAKTFNISPQKTHVSVMMYSDEAKIMSRFGKIKSQQDLRAELDALPHLRGKTRIDLALKLAGNELFTRNGGMRLSSSVRKVAIVITDGRQSPAADAIRLDEAAAPLLVRGVTVLSIGIGDKVDKYELKMMVDSPEKHAFWAETYRALEAQLSIIARETCPR